MRARTDVRGVRLVGAYHPLLLRRVVSHLGGLGTGPVTFALAASADGDGHQGEQDDNNHDGNHDREDCLTHDILLLHQRTRGGEPPP